MTFAQNNIFFHKIFGFSQVNFTKFQVPNQGYVYCICYLTYSILELFKLKKNCIKPHKSKTKT